MSTQQHHISAEAEAARERARDHGKFGTQNLDKSGVDVPTAGPGFEMVFPDQIETGDVVEFLDHNLTVENMSMCADGSVLLSFQGRMSVYMDPDETIPLISRAGDQDDENADVPAVAQTEPEPEPAPEPKPAALKKDTAPAPASVQGLTHSQRLQADAEEAKRVIDELDKDTSLWGRSVKNAAAAQFTERNQHADAPEADARFPYGKMWSNVDQETGQPDFARRTVDGKARPCLARDLKVEEREIEHAAIYIQGCHEQDDENGTMESPVLYRCADMVESAYGSFDVTLPQSREALGKVQKAYRSGDLDKLRDSLADLMEQQQSNGRMVRPVGTLPFSTEWSKREDGMYGKTYGPAYHETKGEDIKQIAVRVRNDLKTAQKSNWIPDSVKYSVRIERYSGGQSLNVAIKGADRDWAFQHERGAQRKSENNVISDRVQTLVNRYNYDGSDIQSDYFDNNYYGHANYEH